jgi:transposase
MLIVKTTRKIRCAYGRDGKSIRQIARDFNLSRNTVKKVLRGDVTEFTYLRTSQPMPKLGPFEESLVAHLSTDAKKARREQRTGVALFEQLQREGYEGAYDSVRRYIKKWRLRTSSSQVVAYIPLSFAPGEAYQFDWSHELVELGGVVQKVKVAHFRLCYSRMSFCIAYHRESLEMVLDAHVKAFEFFGGSCRRGIYDNLKTVVTKILLSKDRLFNARFCQLASHYLVEPVACTPAAGWEKGQVENQVNFIRGRVFVPRVKCADLTELNQYLTDRCRILAAGHRHPEMKERTVAEVFAEEKSRLVLVGATFDGYRETPVRVSSICLVSYDSNRYSVDASAVGRTAMLRAYADRIVITCDGVVIAEHRRLFARNETNYDPWHYISVLERKPGALRNGAPFKNWELPDALAGMREALGSRSDGDRQFVGILGTIATYGLEAVVSACAKALLMKTPSRDVVLNILSHAHDDPDMPIFLPPEHLPVLASEPLADCRRYDLLLSGGDINA